MAEIIIYTTPTCPYCKMAKEFFKENNIIYKEKDVSSDQAALDEMVGKSGQMGVPVIIVEGEVMNGFDKQKLEQLLKIK